jgi:RNA-dependent RNA polymerase
VKIGAYILPTNLITPSSFTSIGRVGINYRLTLRLTDSTLQRPLIAILESQGVKLQWFLKLQEMARTEANNALLSIDEYAADFLMDRHLGRPYGFPQIIRILARHGFTRPMLEEGEHPILDFFLRSLGIAIAHVDRELKYKARIPVPTGVSLVGVADLHGELEEGCVYSKPMYFWRITFNPV